jgi:magnesium-transporting ATPase (P-type)
MIPADGLVVTAEAMTVSEAMLTGESVPVEKKANADELEERDGEGKVFMGTIVLTGIGVLHVTAVGKETEMGKIAASLAGEQRAETPLQSKMAQFARVLTVVIVILAIGLFVVGWLRGVPVREIFMVAVAVAVSAIPEGLVVALTMILVLGMQRLLKRKALVRKLLAAETLGSVTVLCVDKTGTLTRGIMRVVESEGEEPRLAELAQLCNDLSDPIEVAMQEWGEALCRVSTVGCKISEWKRTVTKPFDPEKKYAASEHIYKKHRKVIVRGAPEVVLEMTRFDPATKREWRKKIELLASRG